MSFGAEMKDFISAYQVTDTMAINRQRYKEQAAYRQSLVEERAKAAADAQAGLAARQGIQIAATKENVNTTQTAQSLRAANSAQLRRDELAARTAAAAAKARATGIATDPAANDPSSPYYVPPDPGAIDTADPSAAAADAAAGTDAVDAYTDPNGDPTAAPAADTPAADTSPAIDTSSAAPVPAPITAKPVPTEAVKKGGKLIADALHGALTHLQEHFGLNSKDPKVVAAGTQRLNNAEGHTTPAEDAAVNAAMVKYGIKPADITPLTKSLWTYNYWMQKNQPAKANAAAASFVQQSRTVAAVFAHAADAKLGQGDLMGAAQQLVKGYNAIPDGMSAEIDQQTGTFTLLDDASGKVVKQGAITPQLIADISDGFKGPKFYETIIDAASKNKDSTSSQSAAAKAAAAKAGVIKLPKARTEMPDPTEVDKAIGDIATTHLTYDGPTNEYNTPVDANGNLPLDANGKPRMMNDAEKKAAEIPAFTDAKGFQDAMGEKGMGALTNLTTLIIKHDPAISTEDAAKIAFDLIQPDQKAGTFAKQKDWPGFTVLQDKSDKNTITLQTADGKELVLPAKEASIALLTAGKQMFGVSKDMGKHQSETRVSDTVARNRKAVFDKAAKEDAATIERQRVRNLRGYRGLRG